MRKLLLIPILILLEFPSLAGNIPTTFYVDPAGNDSNTGLATDNAWATVAKVNAFSRTNIARRSESFDTGSAWALNRVTIVADNTTGPDGNTTADKMVMDSTAAAVHNFDLQGTFSDNTVYYWSIYIKPNGLTWVATRIRTKTNVNKWAYFNLSNGTIGTVDAGVTASIAAATNGFYRISSATSVLSGATAVQISIFASDGDGDITVDGDGSSGYYVFGGQIETGGVTTYVPVPLDDPVTASFQPGDTISFKRGQSWAETLTVPSSGTSGAHITYGAYGTGVYPKITGGLDENSKTYVDYGAEAFTFTDITGATFNTVYTSNAAKYEGIDNQVAVSISGTGCTYSKDGAAYTADAGTVIVNDNVTVQKTSSGAASTGVSCVLTVGPNSDTYTVTTRYGIPGRFPEWPTEPSFPRWR